MKASILWLALAMAAPDEAARAREMISAASRAYRAAPGWRDSLVYELKAPNAEPGRKRIDILMGTGTDVAVGDALFRATAVGAKLYLTKSGADATYAAVPYRGDLREALVALTGDRLSVFEPPPVAMRLGKSTEDCLDSFRFNQLARLRVTRAGLVTFDAGQTWDEMDLRAANGSVRARFDPLSHLLAAVDLWFTPQGAPPEVVVQISGEFEPHAVARASTLVSFDPGSRHEVEGMAQLDSTRLPAGVPAKPFLLQTVGGAPVSSAELRGRAVVIDFWATWCAPCWTALSEVQSLARWAEREKRPVTVLAVNTLEHFPTEAQRKSEVASLIRRRSLTVPVAFDEGSKLFDAFGSPGLPSTIVLGPDGTIRRYHQGLEAGLEATLRREVLEALAQDGP